MASRPILDMAFWRWWRICHPQPRRSALEHALRAGLYDLGQYYPPLRAYFRVLHLHQNDVGRTSTYDRPGICHHQQKPVFTSYRSPVTQQPPVAPAEGHWFLDYFYFASPPKGHHIPELFTISFGLIEWI